MNPLDPFHSICQSLLFEGARGELCLRLNPYWPDFVELLNDLGPLVVAMKQGPMTSVCRCEGVDFWPVPDSTDVVDTVSGWILDTDRIATVVAVREQIPQSHLGLQFFDSSGEGLFKLLLTEASELDVFSDLIHFFATSWQEIAEDAHKPRLWADTLSSFTEKLSPARKDSLIKSLLLAYQHRFPLRFSFLGRAMHRSITVRPCRLERCGDDFLLCDCRHQVHLADVPHLKPMRMRKPRPSGASWALLLPLESGDALEITHAGCSATLTAWEALHALMPQADNG
jgi:hypothetical protein